MCYSFLNFNSCKQLIKYVDICHEYLDILEVGNKEDSNFDVEDELFGSVQSPENGNESVPSEIFTLID